MYTNAELKTRVARLAQRSNDVNYLVNIQDYLNYAQDLAFRSYDYYAELEDIYSFSTVNGTESYFMPSSFAMPLRVYDFTNNKPLLIKTEESYTDANISSISNALTGVPDTARLFGISAVNRALSASGITCEVKSSSVLDTGNVVVRIEGYIDSNMTVIDYENITISASSPTTFAAASSPKTFYKITHISKSADTTGFVTIADSLGSTIAIIASTDRASRYPVLKLGRTPAAAYTIKTYFKRNVKKLVDDNDYPFIDADEFFINYAWAYCLNETKETVERSTQIWNQAKGILNEVIRNQQTRLGESFQHKMVSSTVQAHRV